MGMGIWTGMDMNGNMNGNMNGSPLVIKDGLMENHVVSWCSQRTKPPFGPEFFSRPCISKALAYAGILLVIYVYIYIDINISPLHPSLVDDTCTSKFQGILQNSYKIATFFHHVTTYPPWSSHPRPIWNTTWEASQLGSHGWRVQAKSGLAALESSDSSG